jgi:hypothetical protein
MVHAALLLAAAVAAASPATGPNAVPLYRIELAGGQSDWAIGKPQPNGALLLFRRYPNGALMSVRARDVKRISAGSPAEAGKRIQPGELIEVGATGGGAGGTAAGGTASGGKALAIPPPGARKDGSALFNPDRAYKADWDSKLVPGSTMGYPNSPNDYAEGKTIAHPPAPATQSVPGDVPRAPEPNPH